VAAGGRSAAPDRAVAGGSGVVGFGAVAGPPQSAAPPGGGGEAARRQPQPHHRPAPLSAGTLRQKHTPHQGRLRLSSFGTLVRSDAAHVPARHGGGPSAGPQSGLGVHRLHGRLGQVRPVRRNAGERSGWRLRFGLSPLKLTAVGLNFVFLCRRSPHARVPQNRNNQHAEIKREKKRK